MNSNGNLQSQLKSNKNKNQSNGDENDDDEKIIKELPYLFEKELISRQNQFIRPYKKFIPIHHKTSKDEHFNKFYASHQYKPSSCTITKYIKFIESKKTKANDLPPFLENDLYGWLPSCNINRVTLLKMLNPIIAAKRRCYLTVFNEKLLKEKITERVQFNGPRFIVF